jgi:DNA mismatch repair protein MutL
LKTSQTKIRILPDEVANRIAAGEVVERPASVVKELVENAIDSGARNISVRVRGAGRDKIVVSDDGCGMSLEDARTSIKRHATSKIKSAEDLDHIHTLGFRGEALPSIASVSKMRITTRTRTDDDAQELTVEGGKVVSAHAAAGPPGTEFEVSRLFYNTPVRAKFLKTDATELKNIIETVGRIALVHPDVGFELKSETRTLLALPPDQPLAERAAELAGLSGQKGRGPKGSGQLYWEEKKDAGRSFTFAFTAPHENKGRRNTIRLFVNRRAVTDRILMGAVMQGYRGLIESGRYPVAMLWLELPADEVDVNVHPAKREVRFREEGQVFRWVAGGVVAALARAPWARGGQEPGAEGVKAPWEGGAGGLQGYGTAAALDNRSAGVADAIADYGQRAATAPHTPYPSSSRGGGGDYLKKMGGYASSRPYGAEGAGAGMGGDAGAGFERLAVPDDILDTVFGRLSYLGAFDATYLLFEELDLRELVLIDQHAAHERILYEALLKEGGGDLGSGLGGGRAQQLLVPVVVDLSAAEEAMLAERADLLEEVGIKTEPFGPRSLSITQAPAGFSSSQLTSMVKDLLGQEASEARGGVDDAREALAARAACAAAVKARRQMTPSEVRELLTQLAALENPTHCPHGRPLVLKLSRERIESLFHRR